MGATKAADPTAAHVVRFCGLVSPEAKPVRMDIRAAPGSLPLDCFGNVRKQVEAQGGRIQFGWSIWEWPRVYVEAEHHAVLAPADGGPWVDVTPSADGDVTRLFLPDDTATYDFDNEGVRRENHRMPLVTDPLVGQMFELAVRQNRIMNAIPGVGMVAVPARLAAQLDYIAEAKARTAYQLGMKYSRRNDPCFCGSRKKFKVCHGAPSGTL